MVAPLGTPQPVFLLPPVDQIPDEEEDQPKAGLPLATLGPLQFPALIFGAASFSPQYNNDDHLASVVPLRTIRLALRYGIRSFDTSAYYGPSEIILGTALKAIEKEFPRSSYKLACFNLHRLTDAKLTLRSRGQTTKCGRYGYDRANFDYSPVTIRASVTRSLERLHTDYLDAVYLHDVEYVSTPVGPAAPGGNAAALEDVNGVYGLARGDEGKVRGEGDRIILAAVAELWKMKEEGLIRAVGITGYPLPTLLRVALLALHNPPFKALDLVLSYCHLTLQNDSLAAFGALLKDRAQVTQILNASPLSMGLLTLSPPAWHPARAFPNLISATDVAAAICGAWTGGLPNLALGYSMRRSMSDDMSVAVGFSSLREVHESMEVWRGIDDNKDKRREMEQKVSKVFEETGTRNLSWSSS